MKLASLTFVGNTGSIASVNLILREQMNLSGYRIESRQVQWTLPSNIVLLGGVQPLSPTSLAVQFPSPPPTIMTEWELFRAFAAERDAAAGTLLKIIPGSAITPATQPVPPLPNNLGNASPFPSIRTVTGVEVRIIAPDGTVGHARYFVPDANYAAEDVLVLRKADGTGFFMAKAGRNVSSIVPFSPGQYRLRLTYRRDNRALVSGSPVFSEAGNKADEVVAIDIPWQTN